MGDPGDYSLWADGHDDSLVLIAGVGPPLGQHGTGPWTRLAVFKAKDWVDACSQKHEFLGWEPYKPPFG